MPPAPAMLSLALLLAGATVAVCGAVAGTVWRREGVKVRDLFWAGSSAAAHPERYVRPERALIVRTLNFLAVGLFLSGVLVLVGGVLAGRS